MRPMSDIAPTIDPLSLFRVDDRVAIVTGASSGLGVRFARVLHAVGANVVLVARRADRLESLVAELRAVGCPAPRALPADLDDRDGLVTKVQALMDEVGFGDNHNPIFEDDDEELVVEEAVAERSCPSADSARCCALRLAACSARPGPR